MGDRRWRDYTWDGTRRLFVIKLRYVLNLRLRVKQVWLRHEREHVIMESIDCGESFVYLTGYDAEDEQVRQAYTNWSFIVCLSTAAVLVGANSAVCQSQLSLDGAWQLAIDPQNAGKEQQWFAAGGLPEAKSTLVPSIIQEVFPGYHGVAWYAREFTAPTNPFPHGRTLLRFWQVDYLAEVWLNGQLVGGHEGGETPFVLDVTTAIKPGEDNRLVVRVLNPTNEPIDGIRLSETARRCKVVPYRAGAGFDHGGITDSVELLTVPAVFIEDLFVTATPDQKVGHVHVEATVNNSLSDPQSGSLDLAIASARNGETTLSHGQECAIPTGRSLIKADLTIEDPRLWELSDPYLYRVTARIGVDGNKDFHEQSTTCGFRDFRFSNGYFRLNGRRIYLRCTHTCNHFPIGQQFPRDPDFLRRDLLNLKVMGFNAVRFIWGGASRAQLDFCDEIGLLVYNESYASMWIDPSPQMADRFDSGVSELIRRDRNHPSIVMWGLLNEAPDCPAFWHGVKMLPLVRSLDPSRLILLNSGRYDGQVTGGGSSGGGIGGVEGIRVWPKVRPTEPWVALNSTSQTIRTLGITWPAGHLAQHPGPKNEMSVVRFTSPVAGQAKVIAKFIGLAERATTDVHVLHDGESLLDAVINLNEASNEESCSKTLPIAVGDTIDCVVGSGNQNYGADTTGLCFVIRVGQKTFDATAEFSTQSNPNGVWSYGYLPANTKPDASAYVMFGAETASKGIGSLSNPGGTDWEDVLNDRHYYPRVPHTANIIRSLRELSGPEQNVFLSEYGIGSAVDLWRAVRHFEQRGAEGLEDAQFFQDKLNRFLADWQQWHLDEIYPRPEDFFQASLQKMAGQRTLGLNAIRSNPNIIGHSLTGAIDHVMCGEGLTTLFRELKPGTIDAMFDAWAPLRWCLFAEPVHIASGSKIHLEAVLANEDVLSPGEYPARFQVIGPLMTRVFDQTITVTVPQPPDSQEPPFAQLCFSADVPIDGPPGEYQFLATFQRGAAAAGGRIEFYATDPQQIPPVATEVVLWGDDPQLNEWLSQHNIQTKPFAPGQLVNRQVILAAAKPPAPGGVEAFRDLARSVARGATVVFLSPEIFAEGNQSTRWMPLVHKGTITPIHGWLYLKDEWAKSHPIFDGLSAGGLMDYAYYGDLIPDGVFQGQDPPAEAVAGAIKASQDYDSGLMVAVYPFGDGRFIVNTLRIRDNLGKHPVAERLLGNMLRYAACDADKPLSPESVDLNSLLQAVGLGTQ